MTKAKLTGYKHGRAIGTTVVAARDYSTGFIEGFKEAFEDHDTQQQEEQKQEPPRSE